MSKYLIAGLGNIGTEYAHTRHNAGFDLATAFAKKHDALFSSDRLADKAVVKLKGKTVIVIKPSTYMNLSGKAVKYWLDKENIEVSNLLVLVDEIALPLNRIRIRPSGSDAGHNGLRSIQEALGSDVYPRLRIGIGNNFPKGGQSEYVLGKWTEEQEPLIKAKIGKCVEIVESFVLAGITRTMNTFNKFEFTL
jgi:PTH1 family peptidyl-tRNA hydrolase